MDKRTANTLRGRLKQLRIHMGISQRRAGELSGVSDVQVSNIEKGKTPSPSFDVVIRLARLYGESLDDLAKLVVFRPHGNRRHPIVNPPLKKHLPL